MDGIVQAIEGTATLRAFPKRRVLAFQGEVPKSAYILKEGAVKAYSINSSGNEQIASFYTEGDLFPATWIFNRSTNSIYYYEAITDCKVFVIDKDVLLQKIYGSSKLLKSALDYAMSHYTSTLLRITALEQSRASEKIMFTLYYLAYRHSREIRPGKFSIKMNLTHSAIADMVGLTRETTNYELNKLKKMGAVEYIAKEYIVNQPILERLMGEDSFSSLKA